LGPGAENTKHAAHEPLIRRGAPRGRPIGWAILQIHYLGKGLKAGNGSKLVAWWKAEQPGRAIAIYDDFSVKEIDEPAAAE
jgi:hypothetical protein